jgi:hypothetical protein
MGRGAGRPGKVPADDRPSGDTVDPGPSFALDDRRRLASRPEPVAWWRGVLFGGAALALALGLLAAVWLLARPLALLLAAVVIAQALAPAAARLERWLPRALAVLLIYLVALLLIGGVGWVVVPPHLRGLPS